MARRSPLNARYQKHTEPAGKTRKSASAAKPKREAGSQGSAPAKSTEKRPTLREAWRDAPTSPEVKKWNRVWLGLLLVAIAVVGVTFFVPGLSTNPTVRWVGIVLYALALGGGLWVQFAKVRPARERAVAEAKAARKKDGKA